MTLQLNTTPQNKDAFIAGWNDTVNGLDTAVRNSMIDTYKREMDQALKVCNHNPWFIKGCRAAIDLFNVGTMPEKIERLTFDELNS